MMNPVILSRLFATHSGGWRYLARAHFGVAPWFFFYVLPLSIIPALMIYFAGTEYRGEVVPVSLTSGQLTTISVVFFIAELGMTFFAAWMIQLFSNAVSKALYSRQELLRYPAETPERLVPKEPQHFEFRDAFSLAAVAPTPLWLGSLFLFVPSSPVVITIFALALVAAAAIIYRAAPAMLRLEDEASGVVYGYTLVSVGVVAWAAMMYITFFTWIIVTSGLYGFTINS